MHTPRPLLKHIIDGGRGALFAAFPALRSRTGEPAEAEPPLRAELFSSEQMVQHGKALAAAHELAPGPRPDRLLTRLAANEHALVNASRRLTTAATENRRITPAGEWLLDNFYLIEEQIRTARRHLPRGYSVGLPRLANGPSAGQPRVYDLMLEIVSHGDGRVDAEELCRFIAAYQTVSALKLGELWAIPIMLRLALVESLRRTSVRVADACAERDLADTCADRVTEAADTDPKRLILVLADMARSNPPMSCTFVAGLVRRFQHRGPALALPLSWIEQQLAEHGMTIEQSVQAENQQQAADQVSISNSIGSLRLLSALDWRAFVETMSVVEHALCEDPCGMYAGMDFATRDRYRHVVEAIAKKSACSEGEVAHQAVVLAGGGVPASGHGGSAGVLRTEAGDAALGHASARADHVGFYLIDKGRPALERAVTFRASWRAALKARARRCPLALYLGAIALLSVAIAGGLLWPLRASVGVGSEVGGAPGREWVWVLAAAAVPLALLAASRLGAALANWLSTLLATPHPLPRMDFSTGIPPQWRTLVRERARVPPYTLGQRPGQRCGRRGALSARRRQRRAVVADAAADACRGPLRRPPRLWLQRVRDPGAWHRLRAVGVCRHRCRDQVLGVEAAQRIRAGAPFVCDRLRRLGAGRLAREVGHACQHRDRPRQRRAAGAQPLQRRVRRACGLPRRR